MPFVLAAKIADVPVGSVHEIQVAGKAVALANVDGKFFAINNTCLHRGGPLGEGSLQGQDCYLPLARLGVRRNHRKAPPEPEHGGGVLCD